MREEALFEKELQYFKEHKEDLLKHYKDQYVVIKGDHFLGAYTTEQEAYGAGLDNFGNVPFLIKKVAEVDEILRFPALALGVLNANS